MIGYNDNNTLERQRSDMAHELSHIILEHKPRPIIGDGGCRIWDNEQKEQEEEAAWLSGALLVPTDIVLAIARQGLDISEAAAIYGVSMSMMRYRLNMNAAYIRAKREARGA